MFCPQKFEEDDIDVLDHIEKCHTDAQASVINDEPNVENDSQNDKGIVLSTIKECQAQDDMTYQ